MSKTQEFKDYINSLFKAAQITSNQCAIIMSYIDDLSDEQDELSEEIKQMFKEEIIETA